MSLNPSCLFCPFSVFVYAHMCVFVMCKCVFFPMCGLICRCTRKCMCAYVWGTEVNARGSLQSSFCLILAARPLSQTQSLQIRLVLLASLLSGSFVFLSWLELQTGCHARLAFAWGSGKPNCVPCACLAGVKLLSHPPGPSCLSFLPHM